MLAELQADFVQALAGRNSSSLEGRLVNSGVKPEERMAVYTNHLGLTLRNLLAAAYPKLAFQLGDSAFARLCVTYCRQLPMQSPEAWLFGQGIAGVMMADGMWREERPLIGLACIEEAAQTCFYAAEEQPLTARFMAGLDESQLAVYRFTAMPDMRLLEVDAQALGYWRLTESPQFPVRNILPGRQEQVLVQRQRDGSVTVNSLDQDLFLFAQLLVAGNDFISSYQETLHRFSEFDLHLAYQKLTGLRIFTSNKC